MQVSNIHSGTGATNVIPGSSEVLFNFRYSTEVTEAELRQRTEAILDGFELDYAIEWTLSGEPFLTGEGELVAATLASINAHTHRKAELSTAGGTSDGRFIAPYGSQVIELGPINATIHKLNEEVRIADLDTLTDIYQGTLERLFAAG